MTHEQAYSLKDHNNCHHLLQRIPVLLIEMVKLCDFSSFKQCRFVSVLNKILMNQLIKTNNQLYTSLKDDNKQICKQDFLVVDSNLWTPVYVSQSLQAQAAKNMQDLFLIIWYVIIALSVKITAWTSKDYVLKCYIK